MRMDLSFAAKWTGVRPSITNCHFKTSRVNSIDPGFEREYAAKEPARTLSDSLSKPDLEELVCPSSDCKYWVQVSAPEKRSER